MLSSTLLHLGCKLSINCIVVYFFSSFSPSHQSNGDGRSHKKSLISREAHALNLQATVPPVLWWEAKAGFHSGFRRALFWIYVRKAGQNTEQVEPMNQRREDRTPGPAESTPVWRAMSGLVCESRSMGGVTCAAD